MDLFETLGLGPRQPEENELYVAIYADPVATDDAAAAADAWEDPDEAGSRCAAAPAADDEGAASSSGRAAGGPSPVDDRLEALRARCTAWLLPYTTDYVWNKDPLVLRASSCQPPPWERRRGGAPGGRRRAPHAAGEDGPQAGAGLSSSSGPGEGCVWAVMRFGDAVDDEWWAVWLLLRMTRELQDLSVQVWDNDGQFLLIEAAYALPRWLKPETADNRVWLRRGRLHVIPLPSSTAPDLPPSPSVVQALEVLREDRFSTASQRVQRPIDERLARYPARARREQQHTARCLLPVPLAAALRSEPQLVAELVEAFYHRDAEDMRAAARMRVLPASLERVPALVRMTRVHYAQLAQQRFSAPRGLPMPPPDSPLAKAADLGLKLTVAAEIICARVHPQYQPQTRGDGHSEQSQQPALLEDATAATEAVAGVQGQQQAGEATAAGARGAAGGVLSEARFSADPAWRRFKSSLEANGYFQGNIAGSRRYKELLAAALEAFAAGLAVDGEGGDAAGRSAAGGGAASSVDPRRRLAELVRGAAAGGLRAADVAGGVRGHTGGCKYAHRSGPFVTASQYEGAAI
ncbi:hypothetical protein PLESTB_001589500 [Pleodorina starrii]|uniref:Uncharacterized protein n=1 Tax=Pleodorina starrii TaxID=330485 RepID=A0A9W6F8H9_9CHLO|nr:hypothetical protein PLESTM_000581400 [Pleodorina starrii]GLC60238.1 hypothetical protein PLESTB_001589500 [Pleodorina starrii]